MARILIYDSSATAGSAGVAVVMGLAQNTWRRSQPVRAFCLGDIRNVAYEFILNGGVDASSWAFEWYQEFFADKPWLAESPRFPSDRAFPGAATTDPWSREQVEIVGATGAIDHYDATRTITLASPSAKWLPMVIQTLWVRLAIRTTTATAGVSLPKLQIVAHIGGHAEEQALETLTTPYQNNY